MLWGRNRRLFNLGQRPKVYHVNVHIKGLPEALDGYDICQLSDLHRGNIVPERHIKACADMAMKLKCKLIAVTGDFVSTSAGYATSLASALSGLHAPDGVYGVMGNHDHWTQRVDFIAEEMERIGIRILDNAAVPIETGGVRWHVVGVDDMWAGKPDLDKALIDVPADGFKLLLAHCPDFADEAAKHGVQLQLSGHTHGGQVAGFFMTHRFLPKYGRKYPLGLLRVPGTDTQVYVNVGIGAVTMPVRVGRRPEITHLILRREK